MRACQSPTLAPRTRARRSRGSAPAGRRRAPLENVRAGAGGLRNEARHASTGTRLANEVDEDGIVLDGIAQRIPIAVLDGDQTAWRLAAHIMSRRPTADDGRRQERRRTGALHGRAHGRDASHGARRQHFAHRCAGRTPETVRREIPADVQDEDTRLSLDRRVDLVIAACRAACKTASARERDMQGSVHGTRSTRTDRPAVSDSNRPSARAQCR